MSSPRSFLPCARSVYHRAVRHEQHILPSTTTTTVNRSPSLPRRQHPVPHRNHISSLHPPPLPHQARLYPFSVPSHPFSTHPIFQQTQSPTTLTDQSYHDLADLYLQTLLDSLESLQETKPSLEVEYSQGTLEIKSSSGTYVLNKQGANHQIWLSSPVSGPKRFDWIVSIDDTDGGGVAAVGGSNDTAADEQRQHVGYTSDAKAEQSSGPVDGQDGAAPSKLQEGTTLHPTGPVGKGGRWIYLRDGTRLTELLREEVGVEVGDESGEG